MSAPWALCPPTTEAGVCASGLGPGSDWKEFPGRSEYRPLFDGAANIDEIDMPQLGAKGLTLRLFDPVRMEWAELGVQPQRDPLPAGLRPFSGSEG
ncbi:hypothetical protein [Streptomyces azureus]|uniref:Uncharacterized protein n=1 Tax=Streptomyces azureus TaxID=146537 RepID=A0A0K8PTC6_STRAJ|nr:hypothetical protein [Streptomyces azureus]GAP51195.1 uncharacterized protein SAZU_6056 [Streptomyces azureus]